MAKGMRIQPSVSNPLGVGQRGIWVNSTNDLVYEDSVAPVNVTQKISDLESGVGISGISKAYANNTGFLISKFSPVYIIGAGEIALAGNGGAAISRCIGLTTEDIANGATGLVQFAGYINDTFFNTFTVGDHVYLDATPGTMTSIEPTSPGTYIFVVGIADGNSFILQPNFVGVI